MATHHIKNLVFFSFHGSHALFGSSSISSSIAADVIWNSVCTLSGLDIRNTSWFTWRGARSGQAWSDPYQAAQAAAGYPGLKKAQAANAAAGHPNLKKAQAANAAAGHPNLKKAHEAEVALGYPKLKKAHAVNAALGHPGLKKGREAQAAVGYPNLQKSRKRYNDERIAKINALRGAVEIREFLAQGLRSPAKVYDARVYDKWEGIQKGVASQATERMTINKHAIWYHTTEARFGVRWQGDGGPTFNESEYMSKPNPAISVRPVKDKLAWAAQLRREVSVTTLILLVKS